ncbi:MAG: hypothetical protein J3K34DRAFT_78321 [Monoraphidium minutum]|nr:MAG: hypothetical protein J3K34DRAFT_78321 [Monoraphidium minutum]
MRATSTASVLQAIAATPPLAEAFLGVETDACGEGGGGAAAAAARRAVACSQEILRALQGEQGAKRPSPEVLTAALREFRLAAAPREDAGFAPGEQGCPVLALQALSAAARACGAGVAAAVASALDAAGWGDALCCLGCVNGGVAAAAAVTRLAARSDGCGFKGPVETLEGGVPPPLEGAACALCGDCMAQDGGGAQLHSLGSAAVFEVPSCRPGPWACRAPRCGGCWTAAPRPRRLTPRPRSAAAAAATAARPATALRPATRRPAATRRPVMRQPAARSSTP